MQSSRSERLGAFLGSRGLWSENLRTVFAKSEKLRSDSRAVGPGDTFVAVPGATVDGHDFLPKVAAVAAAAFVKKGHPLPGGIPSTFPLIAVDDPLAFSRELAPVYYNHPSRDMRVFGVTGTNGKTTTAYLMEALAAAEGWKPGLFGTVVVRWPGHERPSVNTTPDAVELQTTLAEMVADGCRAVCLELSSHALHQGRLTGIDLDAVVFTNLTRDHMDYHGSMDAYLEAKLLAFDMLHESEKAAKRAAVWAGTEGREVIAKRTAGRDFDTKVFGIHPHGFAGLSFKPEKAEVHGTTGELLWRGEKVWHGCLKRVGEFNVLNTLGALAVCLPWDAPLPLIREKAHLAMETLSSVAVPGRMEMIPSPKGGMAFVDYAHTPDALENILKTLEALPHKRLVCVFGCGGDRDRTKRPIMGRIAGTHSDHCILTSDNPRTEDPAAILAEVATGLEGTPATHDIVADRETAIKQAVSELGEGVVLVVAGKGHEDYQILGKTKIHFDDREMVRKYMGA